MQKVKNLYSFNRGAELPLFNVSNSIFLKLFTECKCDFGIYNMNTCMKTNEFCFTFLYIKMKLFNKS